MVQYEIFTKELDGVGTFSWSNDNPYNNVSVKVLSTSTASATILGTGKLGDGTESGTATLEAGDSIAFVRTDANKLEFTLSIPSGCVVIIIAQP